MNYDYVIVGAGSAGCVLANRLSANPNARVLLLEAGPRDWNPLIHMPAGLARLVKVRSVNWNYDTEPEPQLLGRRLWWPRGKTLGGSSSINAMCYIRGVAGDYDRWAAATGDARWRRQLDMLFARMLSVAAANMFGHLSLLNALDLYLAGAEVVVTGQNEDAEALLKAARALPHANTIVLHVPDPAKLPSHHPAAGKIVASGGAAAFVCRGQTCSLPVTEPDALAALVLREHASAPDGLLQ